MKYGVRELELFGSVSRGDVTSESDIDFLVVFQTASPNGSFRRFMGLKLALEDLLGRPVDLVERDAVRNPHFLASINAERRPIYAA